LSQRVGYGRQCRELFLSHVLTLLRDTPKVREQPAQAATLVIGTQDHFALLGGVTVRLRVFTAALTAVMAQESLFPVRGETVANQVLTLAVATFKGNVNHHHSLPDHLRFLHYHLFIIVANLYAAHTKIPTWQHGSCQYRLR